MNHIIGENILKMGKKEVEQVAEETQVQNESPIVTLDPKQIGNAWAVDAIKDALNKPTEQEALLYLSALNEMATSILAVELFNKYDQAHPKKKESVRNAIFMDIRSRIFAKFGALCVDKKRNLLTKIQREENIGVHETVGE